MATKKYLSYDGLTEYDALLKAEISQGDESAVSSAKTYTDEEIATAKSELQTYIDTSRASQVDFDALENVVAGKASAEHIHDDRYYTETEINEKFDAIIAITTAEIETLCAQFNM